MDDSNTNNKRWQIRVLSGPFQGTSRVLTGRRLTIGRAACADLHLPSSKVSRQHAQIVEDEQGRHVLVDLSSCNGTFAGGQGIERLVLEPNTTFSIVDIDLAYEETHEPSARDLPPPTIDGRTLRGTAQLDRYEAPTLDYPNAEEIAAQRAQDMEVTVKAPPPRPPGPTDSSGNPLVFETPDGKTYVGDLLDDILEYRSLRAQHLRGGFAEPGLVRKLEDLKQRLQSGDSSALQRSYSRFGCWLQGRLRIADGDEPVCWIRNLGVDGAQLAMEEHALGPDAIVWLTIEVRDDGLSRAVVLAGRVSWTDDELVGITFAGAPRRAHGQYAEQPTAQRRRDQLGPSLGRLRLSPSADRS
ncbi:MAG: FHA domain-containing protein [Myxococcales bacterium]|nr:FHA domain-containing protein [Myxococcales bacterium]